MERTILGLVERDVPKRVVGKIMRYIMGWKIRNPRLWVVWNLDEFLSCAVKVCFLFVIPLLHMNAYLL